MNKKIMQNINDLFESYDLSSSEGRKKIRENIKEKFSDVTEEELDEIEEYLKEFYSDACHYGVVLACKFKVPFLPAGEEAEKEIDYCVNRCQESFPEIDKEHITSVFSSACWLQNR